MSEQGNPSREQKDAALLALARLAETIGDPQTRRRFASNNSADFLDEAMAEVNDLTDEVKDEFRRLFGDLTFEELRLLARLQETMLRLRDKGYDNLSEEVNPTVGKF